MHFLAKQEIAHTTNINLSQSLGANYLGEIAMGQNTKYTSEHLMQETWEKLHLRRNYKVPVCFPF
jgi:hypothetical protein